MPETAIILPAYQPNDGFPSLVGRLLEAGFRVIVVDDGSTTPVTVPAGATVLRHDRNRGKGAALKTAFRWILEQAPAVRAVVTADADGQHRFADIVRVAERIAECVAATQPDEPSSRQAPDVAPLVLGTRSFDRPGIPFRSRLGNLWTRSEFRLLTGHWVSDTQSGLRGLPRDLLAQLLTIPGERYEYEIGVLVAMAKADRVCELPIETVYVPGNPTSHYRPLSDTLLTQSALVCAALRRRFLI